MVAGQQDPLAALQRNPTCRFRALASLVDHDPVELAISQHHFVDRRRGADDVRAVEHVVNRLSLELPRVGLELLASRRISCLAPGAGLLRV